MTVDLQPSSTVILISSSNKSQFALLSDYMLVGIKCAVILFKQYSATGNAYFASKMASFKNYFVGDR